MMYLESLPNEILIKLFECFDVVNLFRAFHNLNHRFNQLIFTKASRYRLDFRAISKHDFEIICRQHLPSIIDRIISLQFSDDDETPNLPQVFFSYGYQLNNLKRISLDYTQSFDLLNQITFQCRQLSYLTHLHIHINNYQDPQDTFREIFNNIWSLPKLTHCSLDIIYPYPMWIMKMSTISQSIVYLSMKNSIYDRDSIQHLFQYTPYLKRLDMNGFHQFGDQPGPNNFPTLLSLSMGTCPYVNWLENLFQSLFNLRYLTIQANNILIDGYAWEKILSSYLKHIKRFQLKMTVEFSTLDNIDERVDELLASFQTYFWIEKHQWFVRCDWCPMDINIPGLLYTLPYMFETFDYSYRTQSRCTAPNDLDYSSYDQVQTLYHTDRQKISDGKLISSPMQFFNIRHLKIKLPCDGYFWSVIPKLDRLISLDVAINEDLGYSQLQLLLDQASHLYSLSFSCQKKFTMVSLEKINSASIRRLELFQNTGFRLRYFNTDDCAILAKLPIVANCEVLVIDVENRTDILKLIVTLLKLRALNVYSRDGKKNRYMPSDINDDLIQWLQKQLPTDCSYAINRNAYKHIS